MTSIVLDEETEETEEDEQSSSTLHVLSASADGQIQRWPMVLVHGKAPPSAADGEGNGMAAAITSDQHAVTVRDLACSVQKLVLHEDLLYAGLSSGQVGILDKYLTKEVHLLEAHTRSVSALAVARLGVFAVLASASFDGTVRVRILRRCDDSAGVGGRRCCVCLEPQAGLGDEPVGDMCAECLGQALEVATQLDDISDVWDDNMLSHTVELVTLEKRPGCTANCPPWLLDNCPACHFRRFRWVGSLGLVVS